MSPEDRELNAVMTAALHPWQGRLLAGVAPAGRGRVAAWLARMNGTTPLRDAAAPGPWLDYLAEFLTLWQAEVVRALARSGHGGWADVYGWYVELNAADPDGFEDTWNLSEAEFLARLGPAARGAYLDEVNWRIAEADDDPEWPDEVSDEA